MTHHVKLYPQSDLLSDTYRNPGKDNTTFIFTPLLVVSFLLLEGVLRHFGASIALLCILTVEGLIVGILHDYMHTLFHLRKTFLNRYQWFLRLRELHFIHHKHMQRNLGIFWFGWDHVMGSYEKRP